MKRSAKKMWSVAAVLSVVLSFISDSVRAADLEAAFRAPPDSAKPHVWWHWMAGNVTRAGITTDLEAMADVGIGGAILFDAGLGTRWGVPEGDLNFNTPEWYDTVRFTAQEAKRLGLELGMANCSGWANSGGPWNTPEYAMKTVCFTATVVTGGAVRVRLQQPEDKVGFYRDIAVVAFPTPREAFEIRDWTFKCFSDPGRKYDIPDTRIAPSAAVVPRSSVRDLTADFRDGTLSCSLPPGDWTVLRVGYRALNRMNGTGTRLGKGLECDKLSKEALRRHWANYVGKTVAALGSEFVGPNGPLKTVLNDSYEVGTQNWTQGFEAAFARYAGYAITPWLPALCGRVVDSVAATERFYRDFRLATVATLPAALPIPLAGGNVRLRRGLVLSGWLSLHQLGTESASNARPGSVGFYLRLRFGHDACGDARRGRASRVCGRRARDEPVAEPPHRRRFQAGGLHVRARVTSHGASPQRLAGVHSREEAESKRQADVRDLEALDERRRAVAVGSVGPRVRAVGSDGGKMNGSCSSNTGHHWYHRTAVDGGFETVLLFRVCRE